MHMYIYIYREREREGEREREREIVNSASRIHGTRQKDICFARSILLCFEPRQTNLKLCPAEDADIF